MADNDEWNDAARDAANEDAGWNGGRSPSPRGNTPPRREEDRSRSPGPRGRPGAGGAGGGNGEERDRGYGFNADGSVNPGNNLHVSGVSRTVKESDLDEAFSKFGRVLRSQVMYDPHSRDPRGFAFVTMENAEAADAAIAGMNGVDLMGRVLSVQRAKRGRARTPTPGRYHGPPKSDRFPPGPPGRGGYGPPPPMDYRYGPPPPRDPYDRYGPPPPRDPYDRYGPPPPRDYPPPPRDYPPPRGGYGGRGYSPPPRAGRYDDLPPPPPRGGRYDDALPPPRRGGYDDVPPPPRGRYDEPPPRRY